MCPSGTQIAYVPNVGQRGCATFRSFGMRRLSDRQWSLQAMRRGSIAVEYLLLATIVGIGLIVGLACVRDALVAELRDLALAIRLLL